MAQDPEATPAGGGDTGDDAHDPLARPSKEARRVDETVMLSSDNLSDMVSSARTGAEPTPAATPSQPSTAAAGSGSSPNMLLIVGVVVVVALVIAVVVALTA